MLDPSARWAHVGERPQYAGMPSFAGLPYTEDPSELAGAEVAIVGAPFDELVSDSPGARLGPRAIRAASALPDPHLEAGIDATQALTVVDFGGDHSITEPEISAVAATHGPVGLVHFDAHTDTAERCFGVERSHGTPMRHLVEDGHVDAERYVQIGLRGYWPDEPVFEWQRERGITSILMQDVRERGIARAVERAIAIVDNGPAFVTVDVDALDPAFAPGTGTPEPGGMTSGELLWACRRLGGELRIVGADVVEVSPLAAAPHDITALVASRVVHELLTGVATARARANMLLATAADPQA